MGLALILDESRAPKEVAAEAVELEAASFISKILEKRSGTRRQQTGLSALALPYPGSGQCEAAQIPNLRSDRVSPISTATLVQCTTVLPRGTHVARECMVPGRSGR